MLSRIFGQSRSHEPLPWSDPRPGPAAPPPDAWEGTNAAQEPTTAFLLARALLCPLTHRPFRQGVLLGDGYTYEATPKLLRQVSRTKASPLTGRLLPATDVRPNRVVNGAARRVFQGETPQATDRDFLCPIDYEPMFRPQTDTQGNSFSGDQLGQWMHSAPNATSPITRQPLDKVYSNYVLERVIDVLLAADLPVHTAILGGCLGAWPLAKLRTHDINARDAHGQTPVLLAAKYGQLAALQRCLRAGADVTAADRAGQTPLLVAVHRQQEPAARCLLQTQQALAQCDRFGIFPMADAALQDDPTMLDLLINGGAPMVGSEQRSALHRAVWAGSLPAVKRLIARGANPYKSLHGEQTPIGAAVSADAYDLLAAMLKRPARRG